jgi:hypothetical protein
VPWQSAKDIHKVSNDTMIVTEVDIMGMPGPLTQKRRFRALAGLVARQKILLNLPEIKELRNDEKWDLFDKHVQKLSHPEISNFRM